MLTFGLASPLLALVLIMTFATNVATTMVGIDLYLEVSPRCRQLSPTEDPEAGSTGIVSEKGIHSDDQTPMHLQPTPDPNNGASTTTAAPPAAKGPAVTVQKVSTVAASLSADPTGGLEEACALSAWAPHSLYWPVALIASSFWGLMVFDMVGNTVVADPSKALWAPVTAFLVPLVMGAIFRLLRSKLLATVCGGCIGSEQSKNKAALAGDANFGLEGRESIDTSVMQASRTISSFSASNPMSPSLSHASFISTTDEVHPKLSFDDRKSDAEGTRSGSSHSRRSSRLSLLSDPITPTTTPPVTALIVAKDGSVLDAIIEEL